MKKVFQLQFLGYKKAVPWMILFAVLVWAIFLGGYYFLSIDPIAQPWNFWGKGLIRLLLMSILYTNFLFPLYDISTFDVALRSGITRKSYLKASLVTFLFLAGVSLIVNPKNFLTVDLEFVNLLENALESGGVSLLETFGALLMQILGTAIAANVYYRFGWKVMLVFGLVYGSHLLPTLSHLILSLEPLHPLQVMIQDHPSLVKLMICVALAGIYSLLVMKSDQKY